MIANIYKCAAFLLLFCGAFLHGSDAISIGSSGSSPRKGDFRFQRRVPNFKKIVSFGDSLTDNGNGTFRYTQGVRPAVGYWEGRWTNGPVWHDYVSDWLKLDSTNLAVGGSTTDNEFIAGLVTVPPGPKSNIMVPSLSDQVAQYLSTTPNVTDTADETLYTIFSGHNDFLNGVYQPGIGDMLSVFFQKFRRGIVANLRRNVNALMKNGAKHIVVFKLAPLYLTPVTKEIPLVISSVAKHLIASTNKDIENWVKDFKDHTAAYPSPHQVRLNLFDVSPFFTQVAEEAAAGFNYGSMRDATRSCLKNYKIFNAYPLNSTAIADLCTEPESFMFYDNVHPTTAAHRLLARNFISYLKSVYDP